MTQASSTEAEARGDFAAAFAAAEAWWRLAGVASSFTDEPRDWLASEPTTTEPRKPRTRPTATPPAAPPPPPRLGGDRARWPAVLADFADWWLAEPTLGFTPNERRVAPRGVQGAPLMVLVPQPEATDHDRLLAGPQGRLLAAMLAAVGLPDAEVYVASALPCHLGLVDWNALAEQGIGDVLAHHVRLVAPKRVLVLGREDILPLIRHGSAQVPGQAPQFDHEPWQTPLVQAPSLDALLERPRRKAGVWQTLLEGMGS